MTKLTTISLRLVNGWRSHVPNQSATHCDLDGSKLWQAPHGGVYCNRVHANEHEHEFVPQMGDLDEEGEPVELCTVDGCYAQRTGM